MNTFYKSLLTTIFVALFSFIGNAQTPQFYNSNTTTVSTDIPFNLYLSNKGQWLFGPNLFHTNGTTGSPVSTGSSIKKVYIRRISGNNFQSYPSFTISLAQNSGTSTSFGTAINTSYPYVTPLNSVYSSASFTFTDSLPGWYGFTLSTPFSYDPSQSLVLELKSNITFTVSNGDLLATTSNTGMYQNISGYQSYTAGLNGLGIIDFGFDTSATTTTGCTGTPNAGNAVATNTSVCAGDSVTLSLSGTSGSTTGLNYQWYSAATTSGPWMLISGATNSTYTTFLTGSRCFHCVVTCTNSGLSSISIPTCVTVALPTTSTISQTSCTTPFILNGQSYTASGTYTQTLTNANGCDSTLTLNLTLSTLNIATTTAGGNIYATQSGATYQWIKCNPYSVITGATSQSYHPTANGSYAVIITSGGCTDTSACVPVTTTNISNTTLDNIVSIYPNPTNGQFTVELIENAQVEITNMIGATVYKNQLPKGKQIIHLENESDGIYFVKISCKEIEKTIKLKKGTE